MKFFISLLVVIISLHVSAQNIDTIHAGDGQLDLHYLPKGTQRYLVYIKAKDGQKKNIWLWERTVSREKWSDSDVIAVRQQWTTSDTGYNYRAVISMVNPRTFTPMYHETRSPKKSEAMNVNSPEFFNVDPVAAAMRKKNQQYPIVTTFNWELDLETFALLPLKEGKTFVINFFQPGSHLLPNWYNYTVSGSEKLTTVSGEIVDCFKLYIDYGSNMGNSTWWLSKKTHEVLKMEEHYGAITRYKIKLAVDE